MALTVQNLRAVGTGVEPASLLPGQICFNVTDKVLYVGDGSSFKTNFDGTQVAGVPGEGWYAMPMDFASLGDYYVANPLYYGDTPTDQQVLTWSTALNHPIWTSGGGGGGGNQVYVTDNATVAAASGATVSDKITTAIGVASPDEGDVTIVTGLPDDVYEGLYFFTTEWVRGASYAYPSASEVIYDNTAHPSLTATVQGAISDLDDGLAATTAIANTANGTANSALSIASAALPKAGGTMVGTIVARNIDIQTSYFLQFNGGGDGQIFGITDSRVLSSSTTAASAKAVADTYAVAAAALPVAGGTMTGTITFAAGQIFPVSGIQDATLTQKGIVRIGTNIDVLGGVISVKTATAANLGLVQTGLNIQNSGGAISVLDASTAQKGVVQLNDSVVSSSTSLALTANQGRILQNQINSLTISGGVTLAGGFDPTVPAMDSVTTAGGGVGFVVGSDIPAPAPANDNYYVIVVADDPAYSPPGGGGPYGLVNGDWLLSDGSQWTYLGVGQRPVTASYTTAGIVQLADTAVTYIGTSDTEAVTPNSLQDKVTDSVATTDSNLIASATAVKTAYDIGAAAIPCATITAVGDIVVGGAGPAPTALPVGTDGQVLVANSACAAGLEWVSDTPGDVTSVTGTTPIQVDNLDPQNPVVSIDAASTTQAGAVQLNDTLTSTSTTEAATANAAKTAYDKGVAACVIAQAAVPCASFTAPGELLSGTGAGTYSALAVGSDGQVLLANSLCAEGLEWGNACYVPDACFTATGEIIVGTGVGSYVALPVGTDGQTLVADSTCTEGVKWGAALEGFTTADNTALGVGSLLALTTGVDNTAIGVNTGTGVTGGSRNVLIGDGSGDGLTAGNNNTAVGYNSFSGTGGSNNTVMGYQAGLTLTVGNSNTIIGANAGDALTGANSVVAIGQAALGGGATGTGTVAIGQSSLGLLTSGASNTAVGYQSGDRVTTGSENTLFGFNAGGALTIGGQNILIGSQAGDLITTGSGNTVIGDVSGAASLTNNLILAADTTIKFQANESGAWSPDGTNYGAAGQILTSQGDGGVPTWSDPPGELIGITDGDGQAPYSVALGFGAGDSTTPGGFYNVSIGYNAGTNITGGDYNVGVGGLSLQGTGSSNTAVGSGAQGSAASTGQGNSSVGYQTLDALTSGSFNTTIGNASGTSVTTGARNTLLGYRAGALLRTGGSNTILGAYEGTQTLASNVVLSDGDGNVKLQINGPGAWSPDGTNFGTAGQVLTSNGTGGAPTWTSPAGLLPNYGSFLSTVSQTNQDTTNGNAATFNTTTENNNVSIQNGTQLTVAAAGTYNIQFSAQITKTDGGTDDINVWFKKNGVNVDNSAFNITLVGNGTPQLAASNFVMTLAAGDYVEIWWWSADANAELLQEPAVAPYPAIPSIIATVVPVGA